jgi:YggT family protein
MNLLIAVINILSNLIILVVIIDSVMSYFLSPFQHLRSALDRIINPLLNPIRKVVPLVGMFDLSPLILIILVQILSSVLIAALHAL